MIAAIHEKDLVTFTCELFFRFIIWHNQCCEKAIEKMTKFFSFSHFDYNMILCSFSTYTPEASRGCCAFIKDLFTSHNMTNGQKIITRRHHYVAESILNKTYLFTFFSYRVVNET